MIDNKTNNCKVTIGGNAYALVTNEPEEQVAQAASMVDQLMKELIAKAPHTDEKKLAVLVALRFASKIIQLEKEAAGREQLSEQLAKVIDQVL